MSPLEVGLALPQYDGWSAGPGRLSWETVTTWAQQAEAAGFSSLWLSDHLAYPAQRHRGWAGRSFAMDPLTLLAGLARVTSTARLGTLVLCSALRPPGALAAALATVDILSRGRLEVGLGAGWWDEDFHLAGLRFPSAVERIEHLSETIHVLRRALSGERLSFQGRHVWVDGLRCHPLPVQRPGPPLWVGGRGRRLLGVAAAQADGWNLARWVGTVEDYTRTAAALDRACQKMGRDPATIARSVNRHVLVGEDEADLNRRWERLIELTPAGALAAGSLAAYRRGRLVGTVEQVREQAEEWADAGVATLIVSMGALPFAVTDLEDLELTVSALVSRP
jgi:probable F420-dependent oxidoreductase